MGFGLLSEFWGQLRGHVDQLSEHVTPDHDDARWTPGGAQVIRLSPGCEGVLGDPLVTPEPERAVNGALRSLGKLGAERFSGRSKCFCTKYNGCRWIFCAPLNALVSRTSS